jgi:hypothetical protein
MNLSPYEARVRQLENEGLTRSDAQAAAEAEAGPPTITHIRYGELGKILFDCNGATITIREPADVILVGADPAAAARWITDRYGMLLP